jgi:hypothetical protein
MDDVDDCVVLRLSLFKLVDSRAEVFLDLKWNFFHQ